MGENKFEFIFNRVENNKPLMILPNFFLSNNRTKGLTLCYSAKR